MTGVREESDRAGPVNNILRFEPDMRHLPALLWTT
jgi:hypothetical protein